MSSQLTSRVPPTPPRGGESRTRRRRAPGTVGPLLIRIQQTPDLTLRPRPRYSWPPSSPDRHHRRDQRQLPGAGDRAAACLGYGPTRRNPPRLPGKPLQDRDGHPFSPPGGGRRRRAAAPPPRPFGLRPGPPPHYRYCRRKSNFLSLGEGAAFRAPMARAVIGGLVTSTLLTLLVVPVVTSYLDGASIRVRRLLRSRTGSASPGLPTEG